MGWKRERGAGEGWAFYVNGSTEGDRGGGRAKEGRRCAGQIVCIRKTSVAMALLPVCARPRARVRARPRAILQWGTGERVSTLLALNQPAGFASRLGTGRTFVKDARHSGHCLFPAGRARRARGPGVHARFRPTRMHARRSHVLMACQARRAFLGCRSAGKHA